MSHAQWKWPRHPLKCCHPLWLPSSPLQVGHSMGGMILTRLLALGGEAAAAVASATIVGSSVFLQGGAGVGWGVGGGGDWGEPQSGKGRGGGGTA